MKRGTWGEEYDFVILCLFFWSNYLTFSYDYSPYSIDLIKRRGHNLSYFLDLLLQFSPLKPLTPWSDLSLIKFNFVHHSPGVLIIDTLILSLPKTR